MSTGSNSIFVMWVVEGIISRREQSVHWQAKLKYGLVDPIRAYCGLASIVFNGSG